MVAPKSREATRTFTASNTASAISHGPRPHREGPGNDLVDTLLAAVQLGGDTDTLAAMAGAMAGARFGAAAIPASLLVRLESREELVELAEALTIR